MQYILPRELKKSPKFSNTAKKFLKIIYSNRVIIEKIFK